MDKKLSDASKKVIHILSMLYIISLLIGICVIRFIHPFEKTMAFVIGLTLGSILSIIKVFLSDHALKVTFELSPEKAQSYATGQYMLRSILTFSLLLFSIFLKKYIGMVGTIVGILLLYVAATISGLQSKKG